MPPGLSHSTVRGGMALPALWDQGSLQSPQSSRSIVLREVKGTGGDLEAWPAQVGPRPTLLLQLNGDFSAPFVPIRQSEWQGWKISGLGGVFGDVAAVGLVTRVDSPRTETDNPSESLLCRSQPATRIKGQNRFL